MRIGLIGARGNSQRLPGKCLKPLAGKPLIQWTTNAAIESGCFDEIYVCSDDFSILALAESPLMCHKREPSGPEEKDVDWIRPFLESRNIPGDTEIMLMRPTSPFRGPETVIRAWETWEACKDRVDSLRAVRASREHPYKAWVVENYLSVGRPGARMDTRQDFPTIVPITTAAAKKRLYEYPTQSLTDSYIQCGALEIFRARLPLEQNNLSGDQIGAFILEGPESVDINTEADFEEAQRFAMQERSFASMRQILRENPGL